MAPGRVWRARTSQRRGHGCYRVCPDDREKAGHPDLEPSQAEWSEACGHRLLPFLLRGSTIIIPFAPSERSHGNPARVCSRRRPVAHVTRGFTSRMKHSIELQPQGSLLTPRWREMDLTIGSPPELNIRMEPGGGEARIQPNARTFLPGAPEFTGETDSPLEGAGFELSIPRQN